MPAPIRTTCFTVPSTSLGRVFAYRDGEAFRRAWSRLEDAFRGSRRERQLPFASLTTALRVLSGDFVRMRVWIGGAGRDPYVFVARRRLERAMLVRGLRAWELAFLPDSEGLLASVVEDLHEEVIDVADHVQRREGRCPQLPPWAWECGAWDVAHRLAASALEIDGGQRTDLRMDTDAALLTWAGPVVATDRRGRQFRAVHRIEPKLVTLPGHADPVLHVHCSLSRFANAWGYEVRSAWVDRGPAAPLLLAPIGRRREADAWISVWDDLVPEVLRNLELESFPDPASIDLASHGSIRGRLWHAPANHAIGRGPGQIFHEAAALHVRRLLPEAEPLVLERAVMRFPRPVTGNRVDAPALERAVAVSGRPVLHVIGLYANEETRGRMARALTEVLGEELVQRRLALASDGQTVRLGAVEVTFLAPPNARTLLLRNGSRTTLRAWALEALGQHLVRPDAHTALLVETATEEGRASEGDDPKFVIRRFLAERGAVSQFVTADSAPEQSRTTDGEESEDHAAVRAVWDLFRSAGVFPRAFPVLGERVPAGTWLVGLHVVRRMGARRGRGYVASIVAAEAGAHRATAFAGGAWLPLGEATARFIATDHDHDRAGVMQNVESALSALRAVIPARARVVVFMDAFETRRLWSGLSDTGEDVYPTAVNRDSSIALVRVRDEDDEIPRPVGRGDWPESVGLRRPGTMRALLRRAGGGAGAWYYVSTPRTMDAMGAHRSHTRFTIAGRDLRNDWHSLSVTEFLCKRIGVFTAEDLYELSALLCRQAPTWDGTLSTPAPMHLAKALVKDHPGPYLERAATRSAQRVNTTEAQSNPA